MARSSYRFNGYDMEDDSPEAQVAFLRYCYDHTMGTLPFAGATLSKLFGMAVGRTPSWVDDPDKCYEPHARLMFNLVRAAAVKLETEIGPDDGSSREAEQSALHAAKPERRSL